MKKINEFLQKVEDGKGTSTSFGEKLRKISASILAIILVILLLLIAAFLGMFNWLESLVHTLTGLDVFLAKAIAFLLMALIFGTSLGGMVFSFLPIPQKNKKRKRFTILAVLSILCFIAFFSSRNVYFNPETGKAAKYYSIGPNGEYKFFNAAGYDTETGDKLLPITKEVIMKIKKIESSKEVVIKNPVKSATSDTNLINTVSPEVAAKAEARYIKRLEKEARQQKARPRTQTKTQPKNEVNSTKEFIDTVPDHKPTLTEILKGVAPRKKVVKTKTVEKKSTVKTPENVLTCGFILSFMDNGNLGELDYTPLRCENPKALTEADNCEVVFINDSKGTFKFYDTKRNLLFKVPPQKQTTVTMAINFYYFRASDQENMLPFRLPRRDKFFVRFSNYEPAAIGKIFFHHDADGRNSGARIIGEEEVMMPDNNRAQPNSNGNSTSGSGGGGAG